MTDWERFPQAPIVEALLDIQVTFASPVPLARLEELHGDLRDRYPVKEVRSKWTGEFQIGPDAMQQAVKQRPEGFLFKSPDRRRIVQVRHDGYTFNWLRPYETWEVFRDEAREHWERYRQALQPQAVTRLGLRYINRLELPLPFEDFREYVLTAPEVAGGLPQGLSEFFMRLAIPDQTRGLLAIITETIEPAPVGRESRLPFIFDIDVVCRNRFDPGTSTLWDKFEQMRNYKNELFFRSVTERAKEMFR